MEAWGRGLSETWGSEERAPYVKLAVRSPLAGLSQLYSYGDYTDCIRFIIAHKSRNNETAGIPMVEPLKVNFDFLRRMLHKCLVDHEECRPMKVEEVARLRVIEVTTKRTCQAPPHCEYVALSYVWGDDSTRKSTQGEFPLVVQNALNVTEALGFKYLWVDRYVSRYSYSKIYLMQGSEQQN